MADKIESELAEGIEQDIGLKAMAEKFAPRTGDYPPRPMSAYNEPRIPPSPIPPHLTASSGVTVESKLQAIEKLVAEIRSMSAQVKGLLG